MDAVLEVPEEAAEPADVRFSVGDRVIVQASAVSAGELESERGDTEAKVVNVDDPQTIHVIFDSDSESENRSKPHTPRCPHYCFSPWCPWCPWFPWCPWCPWFPWCPWCPWCHGDPLAAPFSPPFSPRSAPLHSPFHPSFSLP